VPLDPAFIAPEQRGMAVDLAQLTAPALRRRFAAPPAWEPESRADARLFDAGTPPRPAAVLVPLVARADRTSVLLTQRTAHLHDHAGQISFPGGRVEAGDPDSVQTALRETQEEIGLAPAAIDVLGVLPQYLTATGYIVTPVVGLIEQASAFELDTLQLDTFEVAEVFEVPLAFLMNPANHRRHQLTLDEGTRTFYSMPYTAQRRYFIWGATAAMLRNLYYFLRV
jgi:8-oxo-dGTP pyrophosphatase MutT (NUDIX family)